jgi:pimeloyl-ACP methyl ester carboxylesterase
VASPSPADGAAALFDRYGTPGGKLVIFLHGAVANRKAWLPVARELSPQWESWCPDLPGHGVRRDEAFRLEAALETVEALVALARPRRVVLAGDSLGGYVALAAGERIPHGVAGIVAGGCSWPMTGLAGLLARASDLPPAFVTQLLGEERLEAWAGRLLGRWGDVATGRAIAEAGLRLRSRGESLRELAGFDPALPARAIGAPLVVINGAWDWPTRAGEGALVRAARRATLQVVPRTGHGVGLFAPRAFARAVESVAAAGSRVT